VGPVKVAARYHCLVGRLNYLTVSRSNITFATNMVSHFVNDLCDWKAVMHILLYTKNAPFTN